MVRRVEITSIQAQIRRAQAVDTRGSIYNIDLSYSLGPSFITPSPGETWMVEQNGVGGPSVWVLLSRVGDESTPVLGVGNELVQTSGTLSYDVGEMRVNGMDLLASLSDSGGSNLLPGGEFNSLAFWDLVEDVDAPLSLALGGFQSSTCLQATCTLPGAVSYARSRFPRLVYPGEKYVVSIVTQGLGVAPQPINTVTSNDSTAVGVEWLGSNKEVLSTSWLSIDQVGEWQKVSQAVVVPNNVNILYGRTVFRLGLGQILFWDKTNVDDSQWRLRGLYSESTSSLVDGAYGIEVQVGKSEWEVQQGSYTDYLFANSFGLFHFQNGSITPLTDGGGQGWAVRTGTSLWTTNERPIDGTIRTRGTQKTAVSSFSGTIKIDRGQLEHGTQSTGWTDPSNINQVVLFSSPPPLEGLSELDRLVDGTSSTLTWLGDSIVTFDFIYPTEDFISSFLGSCQESASLFLSLSIDSVNWWHIGSNNGVPTEYATDSEALEHVFVGTNFNISLPVTRLARYVRVTVLNPVGTWTRAKFLRSSTTDEMSFEGFVRLASLETRELPGDIISSGSTWRSVPEESVLSLSDVVQGDLVELSGTIQATGGTFSGAVAIFSEGECLKRYSASSVPSGGSALIPSTTWVANATYGSLQVYLMVNSTSELTIKGPVSPDVNTFYTVKHWHY